MTSPNFTPRKYTSDQVPFAMSQVNGKWVVVFVMNGVEFSTKELDEGEAHWIMRRVTERVKEWTACGQLWEEDVPRTELT